MFSRRNIVSELAGLETMDRHSGPVFQANTSLQANGVGAIALLPDFTKASF